MSRELEGELLPSLITGGAGDDPAGVMTYTVVGATTGFGQLWLLVLSTPILAAATAMAGRVALAAQDGLADVLKRRAGGGVALLVVGLLALANGFTIAADSAAVAAVLGWLTGRPWTLFVLPLLLLLAALVLAGYGPLKRALLVLTSVLLAYLAAAVLAHPDPAALLAGLWPRLGSGAWTAAALGLLGTTISPYLLFWQAGEEVEELRRSVTIRPQRADLGAFWGMAYSNLIAAAIVVASAVAFHGRPPQTVVEAARALAPLGDWGPRLFAIGLLASGLLALPTLAGATAYAVAELFGWPEGLGVRPAAARGFYLVFVLGLFGNGAIALLPGFHPAQALFLSQVLDGALLPLMLAVLLWLSNDRRVVKTPNPVWVNLFGVLGGLLALAAAVRALS